MKPHHEMQVKEALTKCVDLIQRLKAENERLNNEARAFRTIEKLTALLYPGQQGYAHEPDAVYIVKRLLEAIEREENITKDNYAKEKSPTREEMLKKAIAEQEALFEKQRLADAGIA
jgi:hypothetical protein